MIAWFAALMAFRDNIFRDTLSQSVVKHKVFTLKAIGQFLGFYLAGIVNDSPMKLVYIIKAVMLKVGASFFATNTSSAVK